MSVDVTVDFLCDQCHTILHVSHSLVKRNFTLRDVVPDKWVAFDPYTNCSYCPDCWSGIVEGIENHPEVRQ